MWQQVLEVQQGNNAQRGKALFRRLVQYYALANEEDYKRNGQWCLWLGSLMLFFVFFLIYFLGGEEKEEGVGFDKCVVRQIMATSPPKEIHGNPLKMPLI